jgi:hypothetical protein
MMQKQFFLFAAGAALLLSAAFVSCQKELSTENGALPPTVTGSPILPATPVQASVSGIVTDENDQPVPNATVAVAGATYTTDSKGFFNSAIHTLDKYISTVAVSVPGYFKAIRSFPANATRNYVSIKLIPKTLAGSFSSGSAGSVSLPNGSQISFTANSIVNKASGAPYSGTVRVYSAYIDPTASDIAARIPGSLIGQDNANMYALISAGMVAVELESDGGLPLQLANGQTAAVKLLIPTAVQGSSPATIDTWSLDDRGVWKKEGTATKNGNFYEFQASHFSFWNCDIPNSSIYLNILVTDQDGAPMPNVYIQIRPTGSGYGLCHGLTDSAGHGTALIPANMALTLSVFVNNNTCITTPIHTQNIGPFAGNGSITVNVNPGAGIQQVAVQGNAINCSGAPVLSGTAIINAGTYNIYHVNIVNGSFSKTIYNCSTLSAVSVTVVDYATLQQSAIANVAVVGNTANAGTLTACGTPVDQFVNYIVDGTTYTIASTGGAASLYGYVVAGINTNIMAYQQAAGSFNAFSFSTPGTSVGTFGINNDSLQINNYSGALPQAGATVTFTSFGTSGQHMEGNFSIPFKHSSTGATVHSCTGTFRIRRN